MLRQRPPLPVGLAGGKTQRSLAPTWPSRPAHARVSRDVTAKQVCGRAIRSVLCLLLGFTVRFGARFELAGAWAGAVCSLSKLESNGTPDQDDACNALRRFKFDEMRQLAAAHCEARRALLPATTYTTVAGRCRQQRRCTSRSRPAIGAIDACARARVRLAVKSSPGCGAGTARQQRHRSGRGRRPCQHQKQWHWWRDVCQRRGDTPEVWRRHQRPGCSCALCGRRRGSMRDGPAGVVCQSAHE